MLYVYQTTNPCICTPSPNPPDPGCPEDCNCIDLCDVTINAKTSDDAVGPCAKTGTINVEDPSYGHDLCACGAEPHKWTVEAFDSEIFIDASISGTTLTWITQGPEALDKQYGEIVLRFSCGMLSAYMCVIVGIKDLCYNAGCASGEVCDDCTGICTAIQVDIEVDSSSAGVDTSLSSS